MSTAGAPERTTQNRVIALFCDELGYRYLGDWTDRTTNSNIEETLLASWLAGAGYARDQINRAIYLLRTEADNPNRSLYDNNKACYSLLRYGVPVKAAAGDNTETIQLVNWATPSKNDFAIAEEVTLLGNHERRPDLVLYLNGLAVGVVELKRSCVSMSTGIRQSISNQRVEFNAWFFSTVRLSLPAMIRKVCSTARLAPKRNIFCGGRKMKRTARATNWTSTCSRCAAKTGCWS